MRDAGAFKVDRLQATLNQDSPVFAGKQFTVSRIWPEGVVNLEFASQGSRMHYASGLPVDKVIQPSKNPIKPAVKAGTNTVILARFNLVELMIQTLVNQRKPSLKTIKTLEILDPEGAEIDARIDLDGGMSSEASVPLRLLTEFGKFVNRNRAP